MLITRRCLAVIFLASLIVPTLRAADYPPPPEPTAAQKDSFGKGIQRTMHLLASSTPERRNEVRVLFYGQSITEQDWSKQVAEWLKKQYPHAYLEIRNEAIGGFASQWLIRTVPHLAEPFYPDLVIFHVYGAHHRYEDILRRLRSNTTAEILVQNDHGNRWPPSEDTIKNKGDGWWDHMMNDVFIPQFVKKYDTGLNDIRSSWFTYLKQHNYEPKQCLKDGVHLNDQGNYLMAELTKRYVVHRPDLITDTGKNMVRTYVVGDDIQWDGDTLTYKFRGNRVDVITGGEGDTSSEVRVLVDGAKPSTYPSMYARTLPSVTQAGWWPSIKRVSAKDGVLPAVEQFTITITEAQPDGKKFSFECVGSVTGPDGSGRVDLTDKDEATTWVSNSGRVLIEEQDWHMHTQVKHKPLSAGHKIRWKVYATHADTFVPTPPQDPTREHAVTIVQGIEPGEHTLVLKATGKRPAIKVIRVYEPPYKGE